MLWGIYPTRQFVFGLSDLQKLDHMVPGPPLSSPAEFSLDSALTCMEAHNPTWGLRAALGTGPPHPFLDPKADPMDSPCQGPHDPETPHLSSTLPTTLSSLLYVVSRGSANTGRID